LAPAGHRPPVSVTQNGLGVSGPWSRSEPVPASVPEPPSTWAPIYKRIVENDGLWWRTLDDFTEAVQSFLDPVLAGGATTWGAKASTWSGLPWLPLRG
jgi:hypothetical protein